MTVINIILNIIGSILFIFVMVLCMVLIMHMIFVQAKANRFHNYDNYIREANKFWNMSKILWVSLAITIPLVIVLL